MKLEVNGEAIEFKSAISVSELIQSLKISAPRVAVELNLDIVSKTSYDSTYLKDGDKIEIVSFVGGG